MKRALFVVIIAALLTGCWSVPKNTAIFKLRDFGPRAMERGRPTLERPNPEELQDESGTSQSHPRVVVYRDIPVEEVMDLYAAPPWDRKEFVFVSHKEASDFLSIQSSFLDCYAPGSDEEKLLKRYRKTRARMIRILGR